MVAHTSSDEDKCRHNNLVFAPRGVRFSVCPVARRVEVTGKTITISVCHWWPVHCLHGITSVAWPIPGMRAASYCDVGSSSGFLFGARSAAA